MLRNTPQMILDTPRRHEPSTKYRDPETTNGFSQYHPISSGIVWPPPTIVFRSEKHLNRMSVGRRCSAILRKRSQSHLGGTNHQRNIEILRQPPSFGYDLIICSGPAGPRASLFFRSVAHTALLHICIGFHIFSVIFSFLFSVISMFFTSSKEIFPSPSLSSAKNS